jgi:competence protein ComEC
VQEAETLGRQAGVVALPPQAQVRPLGSVVRLPQLAVRAATGLGDLRVARRVFVLLPCAMIAGLILYAVLPVEPHPAALAAVGAGLVLLAIALRRSCRLPLAALLLGAWVGFGLLPAYGVLQGTAMLTRPAFGLYQGRVEEIVSATAETRRIVVSGLVPVGDDRPVSIRRARLVVPPTPLLAPGDIIRASMRLAPVPGPILPGSFDGQFHAYFAGIGAYGNVTGDFARVAAGDDLDLTRAVEGLRMAIGGRIDAVLDGPSAAIGRAMVVGDQSAIDDETREVMAASGLAHIYSISGLHLSIVAGGTYFLLRLLLASISATATRWPVKKIAAVGGIVAAAGYLLLAGGLGNVPALRATIMLALIFGAVLAGRQALTMRNVAIAAIAIILIDPASVFRASFQLSFAAVVALIGIYETLRSSPTGDRHWGRRLWNTIWATAVTSFIAGTATLLFSAYHFQQTAPLGVVGNVLVLPVVSFIIMPFAVLSVLAMPLGVEAPFVATMGWGIDRMVDGATLVAGWSDGWTGNPLLTSLALVIGLVALAWFAFVASWWRLLGPALVVPLVLLVGLDQRPDLLIADTTQAVAMRTATGMSLISGRAGSFATDVWGEHYQEPISETAEDLHCDSLGCIARTDRFSIAVIRNPAAFAEDCGLHALVIARVRAPVTCTGSQVIDADALAAGGVHWLRWNEATGRFTIRTAVPNLTRPWRVVPP